MIVIFPMTGSLFFEGNDFHYPKPLIELNQKTLIEHAIDSFVDLPNVDFRFVIKQDDERKFHLSSVIKQAVKGRPVSIITVPEKTGGALCSSLMALSTDVNYSDEEVIISNYDQMFKIDISSFIRKFRANKSDYGLVSFDSIHPKWSYVRLDPNGIVCEASEKNPVSRNALCGLYYFKSIKDLVDAIFNILRVASPSQEAFFVSEVINQLVLMGKKGKVEKIARDDYVNFYEPNLVHEYLAKKNLPADKLKGLTCAYVESFHKRDLAGVLEFFNENASLSDPSVNLNGKQEITKFLVSFFKTYGSTSFIKKSVHASDEISIIHFDLTVDGTLYQGTDVIQWENEKIKKLEAYLTEVSYDKT